jgi:DNA-binding transcriptional regulator YiaG
MTKPARKEGEAPTPLRPVEALVERRKGEQRNFIAFLNSPDTEADCEDAEFFQTLVAQAVTDYGVSRKKLASMLGASEGTISKWISGENSPYPYARPQILRAISALMEERLAMPVLAEQARANLDEARAKSNAKSAASVSRSRLRRA